jgi:hypothetical protein
MNDPLASFHPLDPGRIDLIDPLECAWWCRELHCGEDELREAVRRVGSHVAAVRDWLEHHPSAAGPAAPRTPPVRSKAAAR